LRRRNIDILGIAFIGDSHPESESAICEIGRVQRLGRLPPLSPLNRSTLREAFAAAFKPNDFGL
jgi:dethiobiotin synthetase